MKFKLAVLVAFLVQLQPVFANCTVKENKRVTIPGNRQEIDLIREKNVREVADGKECFEIANSLLGVETVGDFTHTHRRRTGKSGHSHRVTHKNCTFRTVKVVARFNSSETKHKFVLKEK